MTKILGMSIVFACYLQAVPIELGQIEVETKIDAELVEVGMKRLCFLMNLGNMCMRT